MTHPVKPLGLLVCMPTRGAVSRETSECLQHHLDDYRHKLLTIAGRPVVEARNRLAKEVCEIDTTRLDFDPRYVLWTDDDAWWPAGHVDRAVEIMEQHSAVSMVSGVFCVRKAYESPRAITLNWNMFAPMAYERGKLVQLRLAGGHWFVIRRDVLGQLGDEPFNLLPMSKVFPKIPELAQHWNPGEDLSFASRVAAVGKIVTERSLKVGHVDVKTGLCYFPLEPARIANGLETPRYPTEPIKEPAYEHRSYFSEIKGSDTHGASTKPLGVLVALSTARGLTTQTQHCLEHNLDDLPNVMESSGDEDTLIATALNVDPESLSFEPKFVLTCTGETFWRPGIVRKAVTILEDNADVGLVYGLASAYMEPFSPSSGVSIERVGHVNPFDFAGTTDALKDAVNPYHHKIGELIPIRCWCFRWTLIRRDLLCRLKYRDGSLRMVAEINQSGLRAVTERTLTIGIVDLDSQAIHYPNAASAPLDKIKLAA